MVNFRKVNCGDKQNAGSGAPSSLSLSYSLADQSFERTKSIGILKLSVRLAEELARCDEFQRFTIFSNASHHHRLHVPPRVVVRDFNYAGDSGLGRLAWDQWQCYSAARASGNEWLFLPKGFSSFVRKPPVKLALYVHDAMHDFYSRRYPQLPGRMERWYFTRSFASTLRHASIVFTNSSFTASEVRRLARELKLPEPPTVVAGIGFAPALVPASVEKTQSIVVLLGRWMHKRSDLALQWLECWREKSGFHGEINLVGGVPEHVPIPTGRPWRHHLRLDQDDYDRLLGQARAVVYFSEYEGFGMPPVEATMAGACPVFSDLPATREVMREAGFRFSNDHFESFSQALNEALATPRETIHAWRDQLLVQHNWDRVVRRVIDGLRQWRDPAPP